LPEEHIVLAQRDAKQRAAASFDGSAHRDPHIRRKLCEIGDLDKPGSLQQPSHWMSGTRPVALPQQGSQRLRMTAHRDRTELLAVVRLKATMSDAAQRHRLVEHRIEDRGEVAG